MKSLAEVVESKPWWQRCVELVVITACVMGVLLFMANDPSKDEVVKGLVAGFIAFVFRSGTAVLSKS